MQPSEVETRSSRDSTESSAGLLVFVCSVVPDVGEFLTPSFSRAGNSFQLNLLSGIAGSGEFSCIKVWSVVPAPSLNRGGPLMLESRCLELGSNLPVGSSIPTINITPLKQVLLGFVVATRLIVLRLRTRRDRQITVLQYNPTVPPAVITLLAGRLIRARVFLTANDVGVPGHVAPRGWAERIDLVNARITLPRADGVIAVAEAIFDDFRISEGRRLLVDAGVPIDAPYVAGERSRDGGAKQGTVTVGFMGALEPYNGVDLLLTMLEQNPDLDLAVVIAGRGSRERAVMEAARSDPRIHFRGYLDASEVLAAYAECDALLNLRLSETFRMRHFFPSKLIEYLSTGVIVLSTPTAHAHAEFRDCVVTIGSESVEGLVEALRTLIELPFGQRRAMGAIARDRVLSTRTWPALGVKVAAFIRGRPSSSPSH